MLRKFYLIEKETVMKVIGLIGSLQNSGCGSKIIDKEIYGVDAKMCWLFLYVSRLFN